MKFYSTEPNTKYEAAITRPPATVKSPTASSEMLPWPGKSQGESTPILSGMWLCPECFIVYTNVTGKPKLVNYNTMNEKQHQTLSPPKKRT